MQKKWIVSPPIKNSGIKKFPEINPIILQLLFNRGLESQEKIDEFLYPEYENDMYDPYIFIDMIKACDRIIKALENKEKILVYGDYDADGVSSSVLLVSTLELLGGDLDIYIPHREIEGYGLNMLSAEEIIKKDVSLVITVDCGISNKEEVEFLKNKNIDVIVTDHHAEPIELPNAFAVINPQLSREIYPFKTLAGVGVAYKLIQGLFKRIQEKKTKLNTSVVYEYGGFDGYEKWLLDLVAIGTITDCMPLFEENRALVKYGLIVMKKTKRIGLRELIAHININIEKLQTYSVGFQIGPRINAAGRVDHANTAYELLMSQSHKEACRLSEELNKTNSERQKLTEDIINQVRSQVTDTKDQNIIFSIGEGWLVGVVGLVAGKLVDEYNKPVVLMTQARDNIVGSGRSVPEFNMIEALKEMDDFFKTYGGHSQACGFTLKDNKLLDNFKKKLDKLAGKKLKGKEIVKIVNIDTEILLEDITWNLVEQVELFEPFGCGNEEPKFLIKNVEVEDCVLLGKSESHMRLVLKSNETKRKAIAFGFGVTWGKQLKIGDFIDIVCSIGINEWNGNKEIQLKINDIRYTGE